jgi:hypothetical protein
VTGSTYRSFVGRWILDLFRSFISSAESEVVMKTFVWLLAGTSGVVLTLFSIACAKEVLYAAIESPSSELEIYDTSGLPLGNYPM